MQQKENKLLIALSVFCLLIGIAGAAFGIITIVSEQKVSSDFKVTVNKADGSTEEVNAESVNVEEGKIVIKELAAKTEKVIEFPGYGISLKIPKDISVMHYSLEPCTWNNAGDASCDTIMMDVFALKGAKDLNWGNLHELFYPHGMSNIPSSARMSINKVDDASKCIEDRSLQEQYGEATIYIGNNYCVGVGGPQQMIYEGEVAKNIQIQSTKETVDWLTDKDNYIFSDK